MDTYAEHTSEVIVSGAGKAFSAVSLSEVEVIYLVIIGKCNIKTVRMIVAARNCREKSAR